MIRVAEMHCPIIGPRSIPAPVSSGRGKEVRLGPVLMKQMQIGRKGNEEADDALMRLRSASQDGRRVLVCRSIHCIEL